jgi:hypothetical protein
MTEFIFGTTKCHDCGKPIMTDDTFSHSGGNFHHDPCPTKQLDDRLKEIVLNKECFELGHLDDIIIAQIKQAFADAGYIQAHTVPKGIYSATGHSLVQIAELSGFPRSKLL